MLEELATGDLGFAFTMYHCQFFGRSIPHMDKAMKDEFLQPFLEDDTFLLAYSLSEPHGMAEAITRYEDGGFKCFAEKKGDEYVINGTKQWCSNAPLAKAICVNVRTDRKAPLTKCWTRFLVPAGTPGLKIDKVHDHMGLRMLMTASLSFEDMHVPAKYLIGGKEGLGAQQNDREDAMVVLFKNTHLLGALRTLYEESLEYAKTRVVCGKPIIERDTIKYMLAEMRTKIDAGRMLVWRLAHEVERHPDNWKQNNQRAYALKGYLNEISLTCVVRFAEQIHGGYGADKEMLVEKVIRDVITLQHGMCNGHLAYLLGAPTADD